MSRRGTNFSLGANYFNTFVLERVALFDLNDNPILQWTMTDLTTNQALFDHTGRLAPVGPTPELPERATFALFAFASLASAPRRKR